MANERIPGFLVIFICKVCNSDFASAGLLSPRKKHLGSKYVECKVCKSNGTSIELCEPQSSVAYDMEACKIIIYVGHIIFNGPNMPAKFYEETSGYEMEVMPPFRDE